jgi:hypothetical protein
MKLKYQITIGERFFKEWQKEYETFKKKENRSSDTKFLCNLIDELFSKADINKLVIGKYNDFEEEVYLRYITYVKNQIYKILPLAEEHGEWRKHLDTLITELTGSDSVFLQSINFISLINKLETLKALPNFPSSLSLEDMRQTAEFKLFRKTIFECMNIAEDLSLAGEYNAN